MTKLFEFFRYPTLKIPEAYSSKEKIRQLLSAYLFCMLFIIGSGILILLSEKILKTYFQISSPRINYHEKMHEVYKRFGDCGYLVILFLAPVYEELIFRLYLNLKKLCVSISFSLLAFGLTGPLWTASGAGLNIVWRIGLVILVFIFLQLVLTGELLTKLKESYFLHIFYFSVLLFAFVHISNFKPYNGKIFFIYPLFILPQIGMGLSLGYIRIKLKNGFFWAILFHSFINLPGAILHLI